MNNWFESRGLKTLDYQTEVIADVKESLKKDDKTVLAACPSAGKTIMSIHVIDDYFKQNPNHKGIVLAHGTTILRTQYYEVLEKMKPDFTYNLVESYKQYDSNKNLNICLPQTLNENDLEEIDILIVDEAHQFYFGKKMMKDILKKTKPKRQLLLTGTPSIFIRKDFPIIPVTLNTIFDEGMVSDVYVEIATSSYNFTIDDYNQDFELKSDISFKKSDTRKTLDDLIHKIVDRLKGIRGNEFVNFKPDWLPTLKELQKTMFVCKSQQQAKQVKKYFTNIGVESALSISDTDYDSSEIERFKEEINNLVLIVVGRGILGFNYPELVNVVDMTTSQNVDRIFQLFNRVIRKHPKGNKKLFFKVAPNHLSDYYKYIMTAVLSLADDKYFTKFNGKNFNDMMIPVKRRNNTSTNSTSNKPDENKKKSRIRPVDFEGLPVFQFFRDIYHKKDKLLNIYAMTTIRDVRAEFMKFKPSGYWTKEKCLESALKYETRSEWKHTTAYRIARENGWSNDCTKHMEILKTKWTKEKCLKDALKYKSISDWIKDNQSAYNAAKRNGWFEECTKYMEKRNMKHKNYWTKEKCLKSASKYETKNEWRKNDGGAHSAAKRNGWSNDCTKHMGNKYLPWTKERCLESALKHKTRSDWAKDNQSAYNVARKNGWSNDCTKHMEILVGFWTKEKCLKSASKYETKNEWRKNDGGAHSAAKRNGWYKECTSHMK